MCHRLTQKSYILSEGFSSGRSDPTSPEENTRGFIFLRFFRDLCAWFSPVLNSLVNERTILTFGFYAQKLNCLLTVLLLRTTSLFTCLGAVS